MFKVLRTSVKIADFCREKDIDDIQTYSEYAVILICRWTLSDDNRTLRSDSTTGGLSQCQCHFRDAGLDSLFTLRDLPWVMTKSWSQLLRLSWSKVDPTSKAANGAGPALDLMKMPTKCGVF